MPYFESDTLYIIESLPQGEFRDGELLHRSLKARSSTIDVSLSVTRDRVSFLNKLDEILDDSKTLGTYPLIHLCMHGNDKGIWMESGDFISWKELADKISKINLASKNHVVVTFAVCQAAYFITVTEPLKRSPFWGLVGCRDLVYDAPSGYAFVEFYDSLINEKDLNKSLRNLNFMYQAELTKSGYQVGAEPYRVLTTQEMVDSALNKYMSNTAPQLRLEQRAKFALKFRKEKLSGSFNDPLTQSVVNNKIEEVISRNVAKVRNRFLMLDLYPGESGRYS